MKNHGWGLLGDIHGSYIGGQESLETVHHPGDRDV